MNIETAIKPKVWVLETARMGDNLQAWALAHALGWETESRQLRFNLLFAVPNVALGKSLISLDEQSSDKTLSTLARLGYWRWSQNCAHRALDQIPVERQNQTCSTRPAAQFKQALRSCSQFTTIQSGQRQERTPHHFANSLDTATTLAR